MKFLAYKVAFLVSLNYTFLCLLPNWRQRSGDESTLLHSVYFFYDTIILQLCKIYLKNGFVVGSAFEKRFCGWKCIWKNGFVVGRASEKTVLWLEVHLKNGFAVGSAFEKGFCAWKCIFRRSRNLISLRCHHSNWFTVPSFKNNKLECMTNWKSKYNLKRTFSNLEISIYTCVCMEREHYPENVAFLIRGILESSSCDVCIFLKK